VERFEINKNINSFEQNCGLDVKTRDHIGDSIENLAFK
jgi:hypothetical protein